MQVARIFFQFGLFVCLSALPRQNAVSGQTPVDSIYPGGLIFEDATYEALPRQSTADGSKADLPAAVDLTPYCPEIRHQGYIFSCVGWAAGYGAMSIQRAILNQCRDREVITRNAHSALFLYNQIKTADCKQGARISDALSFLTEKGDCLARQFDFEINNCEQMPDSSVTTAARRYAIQDYLTLFGTQEKPEIKILRVKKVLAAQKPVIVGMSVLRNFYDLKNAQYWHPTLGNTNPAGGHAMVVVGYDERREAFRLMNSWGKTWGDNGFIWIKYKDFGDYCKYAFALYLLTPAKMNAPAATPVPTAPQPTADTKPAEPPGQIAKVSAEPPAAPSPPPSPQERPLLELSGQLEFRAFTGWQEHTNQAVFEPAAAQLVRSNTYTLHRRDWPPGQLFQLIAASVKLDQYLYVFSVDATRTVHFHWPRQAGLNEQFAGQNESALLVAGSSQVVIPGATKALKLVQPGTDRLVLLIAKKKIDNISKLADMVSKKEGDFTQNLWQMLGKFAISPHDIAYFPDRIGFEANTRGEGWIVPLVLEVETK